MIGSCTVDMQQTLQIVFPLTVSSIPDTAGVMIGACTVDMQQTLQIVFPLTISSIPDTAGVMNGACTVDMLQTLQIVFPLTVSTVSSIPDSAGVMNGTFTVDMLQTIHRQAGADPGFTVVMGIRANVCLHYLIDIDKFQLVLFHKKKVWTKYLCLFHFRFDRTTPGSTPDKCFHLPV